MTQDTQTAEETLVSSVIIVGAGIIGAVTAYHLAQRGVAVTIIERGRPAAGATAASFAWINASAGRTKDYFDLRQRSLLEYRTLSAELNGGLPLEWSGSLIWDEDEVGDPADFAARYSAWSYESRVVGKDEVARREPAVKELPDRAVLVPDEGSLHPVKGTLALLEAAKAAGARLIEGWTASRLVTRGDRVVGVETEGGEMTADCVLLASGSDTQRLCDGVGLTVPIEASPGLLAHCKPHARLINHILITPGLHMRQDAEGRLIAGRTFGGGPVPNDRETEGRRLVRDIKDRLKGAKGLEFETATVGYRPIPADGYPAIGFAMPGLYVAAMHSGITLAPAVGRFAAMEILDGAEVSLLAPFRPGRFS